MRCFLVLLIVEIGMQIQGTSTKQNYFYDLDEERPSGVRPQPNTPTNEPNENNEELVHQSTIMMARTIPCIRPHACHPECLCDSFMYTVYRIDQNLHQHPRSTLTAAGEGPFAAQLDPNKSRAESAQECVWAARAMYAVAVAAITNLIFTTEYPKGTVVWRSSEWCRQPHNEWYHERTDDYHMLSCRECGFTLRLDRKHGIHGKHHYKFNRYCKARGEGPIHGVLGMMNIEYVYKRRKWKKDLITMQNNQQEISPITIQSELRTPSLVNPIQKHPAWPLDADETMENKDIISSQNAMMIDEQALFGKDEHFIAKQIHQNVEYLEAFPLGTVVLNGHHWYHQRHNNWRQRRVDDKNQLLQCRQCRTKLRLDVDHGTDGSKECKFNKYFADREGQGPIHGVIGIINIPGSASELLSRRRNEVEPQEHLMTKQFTDNSHKSEIKPISGDSDTRVQSESGPTASTFTIHSAAAMPVFPYDTATTSTNIGCSSPQQHPEQHLQRGAPTIDHQTTMGIDLQSNPHLMIHHVEQNMKYFRQFPRGTVVLYQSQWYRHSHNTWSHHQVDKYHLLQCFECGLKLRMDVDHQLFEHYTFKKYCASKGQRPIYGVIGIVNVQRCERTRTMD